MSTGDHSLTQGHQEVSNGKDKELQLEVSFPEIEQKSTAANSSPGCCSMSQRFYSVGLFTLVLIGHHMEEENESWKTTLLYCRNNWTLSQNIGVRFS